MKKIIFTMLLFTSPIAVADSYGDSVTEKHINFKGVDPEDKSTWREYGSSSAAPAKPGAIIMNPRTGALERKPSEEELQREAAERAEKQAEKAREWERTRPQREAEERSEQQKQKEACSSYHAARRNCATAGSYSKCMEIKLGLEDVSDDGLKYLGYTCSRYK